MNILVVEDEPKAGNYLLNGRQELGYSVSLARNDLDGLHLATVNLVRRHRARRDDADNE